MSKARTNVEKLRNIVSVKDFGAVGDGVVDDTAAIHAAIDYAKARRGSVFIPVGNYRVTSGYTDTGAYQDVRIYGEGSTREVVNLTASAAVGSHIQLDSTSPTSFFYKVNARSHLQIEDLTFSCAQFVQDRKFLVFNAIANSFSLNNLNFESVEKPICFDPDCYFQSSTITNVQFRSSGTIHSTSAPGLLNPSNVRATLLILTDVHHEGSVPENSDKIVCDLSGIRWVQATNLLLEGGLPSSGWTILRLVNPDGTWTRSAFATFHNFWTEWPINPPVNSVWQTGGRAVFQGPYIDWKGTPAPQAVYKIDGMGAVELRNASFSGTDDPVQTLFNLENYLCQVNIKDSNGRDFGTTKTTPNYTLTECSEARNGTSLLLVGTNFTNTRSETLWEFDGGYPDAGRVSFAPSSGNTAHPSVDATYGRKLVLVPSGNDISLSVQGLVRQKTVAGQQIIIAYRMKLPTFTGGVVQIIFARDGSSVGTGANYTSASSNTEVQGVLPFVDTIGGATNLGFAIGSAGTTGVSGNLELYFVALYLGKSGPQSTIPSFPSNVVTFAAAIPTVGEWKRGDIIWNTTPSAGGTPGWVCVTAGTPGTWKAMANVAA